MKNKKMKKVLKITIITLFSLLGILIILFYTLPVKPRNYLVRQYVYSKIPIGTNLDEAIDIVEKDKNWRFVDTEKYVNGGIIINEDGDGINLCGESPDDIGAKTMLIELFQYHAPFDTSVQAYLVFDENDKMIAVGIRRDVDAL